MEDMIENEEQDFNEADDDGEAADPIAEILPPERPEIAKVIVLMSPTGTPDSLPASAFPPAA